MQEMGEKQPQDTKYGMFWRLQRGEAGEGGRSQLTVGTAFSAMLKGLDPLPKVTRGIFERSQLLSLHIQIVITSHVAIFGMCGCWG